MGVYIGWNMIYSIRFHHVIFLKVEIYKEDIIWKELQ